MELSWSRWFRCESSFGLLLVPDLPGVFALAEEVVQPAGSHSRRILAVFEINEAERLVQALSRLFAPASPWHERLKASNCYLRYAVVADAEKRHTAAEALKTWLSSQMEAAATVFEQPLSSRSAAMRREHSVTEAEYQTPSEAATVAERAVDRVMATKPVFPSGF